MVFRWDVSAELLQEFALSRQHKVLLLREFGEVNLLLHFIMPRIRMWVVGELRRYLQDQQYLPGGGER